MGQATLVTHQIDDATKLIDELRKSQFDVQAAFWKTSGESERWHLYLVSNEADRGLTQAYSRVNEVIRRLADLWVDPFDVKLLSPKDPTAEAITNYLKTWPPRRPMPVNGERIGNVFIENAIIYPS